VNADYTDIAESVNKELAPLSESQALAPFSYSKGCST
jgi:hypothetical protein